MRRTATALATLALLVPVAAFAQEGEPAYAPAGSAHQAGRWSMQFEVDDDFQLTSFDGAGIALTRNSSNDDAWRLGLLFNGTTSGGDVSSNFSGDSGSSSNSQDLPETSRFGVGLDLLRLHRYHPDRRISLEFAFGPSLGFDHSQSTQTVTVGTVGTAIQESHFSNQTYGLVGRFGVEVFLARALSLHAHYGAFAGYRHTHQEQDSHQENFDGTSFDATIDDTLNSWSLSNLGVTLGVSAYL